MRSISRSLGSGISILRSPSLALISGLLQRIAFRQRLVDLAGGTRRLRHALQRVVSLRRLSLSRFSARVGLQPLVVGLQPADLGCPAPRVRRAPRSRPSPSPVLVQVDDAPVRVSSRITPSRRRRQRIAAVLGVRHRLARAPRRRRQHKAADQQPRIFLWTIADALSCTHAQSHLLRFAPRAWSFQSRRYDLASYRARGRISTRRPAIRSGPGPKTPRRRAHRPASRTRRPPAHPAGSAR